ncbi:MAG: hypothetical protein HGA39_01655 [Coriobacteriia bacterium]|nr:hypothetical protein [Coriobacteriia bacterium]
MSAPAAPRVLCIAGSGRRHGNSEGLLDALMRGVEVAGGLPVKLVAMEADIGACGACNACSRGGCCIKHDGMEAVYSELDSAEAVIVATPVYFATVPAVLKMLYDRCQPYWVRRFVLGEPPRAYKRPGAALVVGGGGDPFGTGCAIAPTKSVFAVLGVSVDHVLEVVGPDEPTDIAKRPEALSRAEEIGRELVLAVLEARISVDGVDRNQGL